MGHARHLLIYFRYFEHFFHTRNNKITNRSINELLFSSSPFDLEKAEHGKLGIQPRVGKMVDADGSTELPIATTQLQQCDSLY